MKKQKIEYPIIEKFVKEKFSKYNTQRNYQRHLTNFFKWLKQEPETYLKQKNKDIYQKDIENYLLKMVNDGVPPKSRKGSLAAIKTFMIYNLPDYDSKLTPSFWFKLSHGKYKGSDAMVQDKVPTPETLKKILMGANLKSKTLFMMLATSGMRIGEALSLNWKDIDFNNNPVSIKLSPEITKTKQGRTVFITNETKDVLLEWKDSQDDYAEKRKKYWIKHFDKDKVFSFCYQNAVIMWWVLLKNSRNMEEDHDRYVYHPHSLRKYFRSRLAKVLAPDYIEFLMGHHTPRTKEYLDLPIEELGQEYLSGMDRLLIFQTPADTTDIRERLQQKDKEIKELLEKQKYFELRMQGLENALKNKENTEEIEKLKNRKK